MRRTVSDVHNPLISRIPSVLGKCYGDYDAVMPFLNEGTERLLPKGHWWGSYGRFRICATDGCLTLPVWIAALERAAVCGGNVRLHDMWYEFLENGFGLHTPCTGSSSNGGDSISRSCACGMNCFGMSAGFQRGTFPTFNDVRGTNKKLNVICDLVDDVGKEVLLLGYDENGNWIRTDQGGSIKDGEIVALAQSAGTISVNKFTSVTDIQPPEDLDGQWWLYEYNTDDATKRLLGHYQYFETRPSYQRYFFPGICPGTNSDDECNTVTLDVIGKLDFIPVKVPTDYLIIGNLPAMKEICRAIYLAENEPDGQKAAAILVAGETLALRELDKELQHYLGDRVIGVDIVGASVGSSQPIPNLL